ncbi:ATP-binding protein [Methyloglobulus sp.]|uniref:ATP-binding protein n=1 Tax=Methyloglobulus sp. TaxID=2518622 RepID=UPI0032B868C5
MKSPNNVRIIVPDSGYSLITRERTEKLELLNHLITNLAHAIVVCGPEGVGKTRLLKAFQETIPASWILCLVQGGAQVTLEKIQDSLSKAITQNMPNFAFRSLANAFDRLAGSDTKIVLVIDDAGQLVPGLIEELLSFVDGKPVLRIVFALTHSELYIKNGSDPAIDDCYQIEIPALTEQQCGEFLEYLSTLAKYRVRFNAINESMVTELYRETHGIPGSILAHLPAADDNQKTDYSKAILVIAVVGLVILALGVQWWSSKPKIKSDVVTTADGKQENSTTIQQPTVSTQDNKSQSVTTGSTDKPLAQGADKILDKGTLTVTRNDVINDSRSQAISQEDLKLDDNQLQTLNPVQAVANPDQLQINAAALENSEGTVSEQVQVDASVALDAGGHWLMEQPAENVTLQLMALPNEQAIIEVVQRHQALGQNLKYLKTKTKRGKDRFVLLYGSFVNPGQANQEVGMLPRELQKSWMRKISAVQGELNIQTPTDTPE